MIFKKLAITSITLLLFNFILFPARIGLLSTKMGLFPSEDKKKSPLFRKRIVPCLRDTFHAGPSKLKSTSTLWSFVDRPTVILKIKFYTILCLYRFTYFIYIYYHGKYYLSRSHKISDKSTSEYR